MQVISILGLAPYYIASRIFAKKKKKKTSHIGQCTQSHLLCHQPISRCGFLAATEYALKRPKALIYGILPQWKPNLKHFFTVPDLWTWQILCHQPISCHSFSTATEDVLNWTLGLDIRGTTVKKSKIWAGRSLLIHVLPCYRFIHSKMADAQNSYSLY